jgi:hypothetical protein
MTDEQYLSPDARGASENRWKPPPAFKPAHRTGDSPLSNREAIRISPDPHPRSAAVSAAGSGGVSPPSYWRLALMVLPSAFRLFPSMRSRIEPGFGLEFCAPRSRPSIRVYSRSFAVKKSSSAPVRAHPALSIAFVTFHFDFRNIPPIDPHGRPVFPHFSSYRAGNFPPFSPHFVSKPPCLASSRGPPGTQSPTSQNGNTSLEWGIGENLNLVLSSAYFVFQRGQMAILSAPI